MGASTSTAKKPVASGPRPKNKPKKGYELFSCLFFGALLGLCAPGVGFWPIAWVGLAPLLISVATAARKRDAFFNAVVFGLGYNCVYMNWYLGLAPLDWLGFNHWQSTLMAATALFIVSLHQAFIIGVFAFICRLLPMKGTLGFQRASPGFYVPALWTVPLLWVLIVNKLGNAHTLTGVPWSMLEYSQYQQLPLIQIAGIVGGIGIGYLIVLTNVTVALLFLTYKKSKAAKFLLPPDRQSAGIQALVTTLLLLGALVYGFWNLTTKQVPASTTLSMLQTNVNIDMQKSARHITLTDLLKKQEDLLGRCPPGICIWSESAVPAHLGAYRSVQQKLSTLARKHKLDMVVGAIDDDNIGRDYNAAFAIHSDGTFIPEAYRKRYLVPFGEYTPWLVRYMPIWIKRLTNTPAGTGYSSGIRPTTLSFDNGRIAPLICFETISPELASASVRAGGQLLVNLSDLAWFHKSAIGEQMLSCAVFRAIENQRFMVFVANTGPSAIIAPSGKILEQTRQGASGILVGKVGFNSRLSPFTRWFLF